MPKPLTTIAVNNLKPTSCRREVPDAAHGLRLIVQPSGKMSWAVRYRFHGAQKKLTLGPYPKIDLKTARNLARKTQVTITDGTDPAAAKANARVARRQTSDAVEKVIEDFVALYAKPSTRDWKETQRLLRQFAEAWKGRRLADIGKADIHRVLDGIVARGSPVAANRTFAQLRKMCRWAVSRGILERSPCEGINPPSTETARDRVLDANELRLIWRAANDLGFPFSPIVKLLVLTGQRRSEVGGMEWGELDSENRLWTIPAARTKNRRQHALPLSPQTIEVIKSLQRFSGSKFVFGAKAAPFGYSKAKERLDGIATKLNGGEPIPPWIFHDIRRSVATGLASIGTMLPVIERIFRGRKMC